MIFDEFKGNLTRTRIIMEKQIQAKTFLYIDGNSCSLLWEIFLLSSNPIDYGYKYIHSGICRSFWYSDLTVKVSFMFSFLSLWWWRFHYIVIWINFPIPMPIPHIVSDIRLLGVRKKNVISLWHHLWTSA